MYLKASHLIGNASQKDRADRQSIRPDVNKTRGLETLSDISKFDLQCGSGDSVEQPSTDVRHSPLWCGRSFLASPVACRGWQPVGSLKWSLIGHRVRQSELLSLHLLSCGVSGKHDLITV